MVLFCGTAAAAFGPIFAGWIFDVTGSYFTAFAALAFLALVALGVVVVPISMDLPVKEATYFATKCKM